VYHHDELLRHICAANGAIRIANGKEWIVCGGGRLLADLSAKSMLNNLLDGLSRSSID
jgi:hypothetical protein